MRTRCIRLATAKDQTGIVTFAHCRCGRHIDRLTRSGIEMRSCRPEGG